MRTQIKYSLYNHSWRRRKANNTYTVKDLKTGEQSTVDFEAIDKVIIDVEVTRNLSTLRENETWPESFQELLAYRKLLLSLYLIKK